MIAVPESLPDDPILLKHLLLLASEQAAAKDARIEQLQEQVALLRHKRFSPKSERSPEDADSPQLAMFNEVEELIEAPAAEPAEAEAEEVVAPVKRRGKRKPLPANLPRVEVIHELPEHELTCACGACKQVIGEETSEQLEIIPMQVRVIRHIRKTYACKACETAPVTADKPAQLIEKSLAVEKLMQEYYRAVATLRGLNDVLLQHFDVGGDYRLLIAMAAGALASSLVQAALRQRGDKP